MTFAIGRVRQDDGRGKEIRRRGITRRRPEIRSPVGGSQVAAVGSVSSVLRPKRSDGGSPAHDVGSKRRDGCKRSDVVFPKTDDGERKIAVLGSKKHVGFPKRSDRVSRNQVVGSTNHDRDPERSDRGSRPHDGRSKNHAVGSKNRERNPKRKDGL
jgi:hypothetical protein